MKVYQINDLERLTGVKAHTIRIWEKRYGLISPSRTDTNRRYYDDAQVRKLLNVTTLISFGHKISKIAAYSDSELYNILEREASDTGTDQANVRYVNDLIACMLAYDEAGFERVFSAAVLRMGFYETMLNIVYPFMNKTGVLWSINDAAPVQEHFASCIVRKKLIAATDGLLPGKNKKKSGKALLFLPAEEWHELGLLFANYILLSNGYSTIYLGQNLPTDNVREIVKHVQPDYALTFFVTPRPKEEILRMIEEYAGLAPKMKLLIAGSPGVLPEKGTKVKSVTYMKEVADLLEAIK